MSQTIDRNNSTDNLRVGPIVTLPQIVSEDHDLRRIGAVILVSECSANLSIHAVRLKESAGDSHSCHIGRSIRISEDRRISPVSGYALEAPAALKQIVEAARTGI